MKKLLVGFLFVFFYTATIHAQSNKTFFLGHSLVNWDTPNMVNRLSIAGGKTFSYEANIGIGAPLSWLWSNPNSSDGAIWNTTLPQGGFENFILTEAIPLAAQIQWNNSYGHVDSFYNYALAQNPGIKYYLYETWHCTKSGDGSTGGEGGYPCSWDPESVTAWRQRLDIDITKWEGIAESLNAKYPDAMQVIPAGQAMGRLYDYIEANNVPGMNSINDVFSDDIHLTTTGIYFIACVMYGVIHNESPEGLPNQLNDEWGTPYSIHPTPEQALILQKIAWETICNYPNDGVECSPVSISDQNESIENILIYPNPAQDRITITGVTSNSTIAICNIIGEIVHIKKNISASNIEIDISGFQKGIYLVKVRNGENETLQKLVVN